jgi:hypothetical protein
MSTGHGACWATWPAVEPSISRVNPPAPREPSTIMSASPPALMISSTGKPCTAVTVTDSVGSVAPGQCLVGFRLDRLADRFGPFRVIRVERDAAEVTRDGLVHGEHGQRCVPYARFLHRPFQRTLGMAGTVYADNDSRHFRLLLNVLLNLQSRR